MIPNFSDEVYRTPLYTFEVNLTKVYVSLYKFRSNRYFFNFFFQQRFLYTGRTIYNDIFVEA